MTVQELKNMLEYFDGDLEVRIMTQQSWPFENLVKGIVERRDFDLEETEENCVFIIEGSQICYGNQAAWACC